jgi:hypothetical protein
MQRLLRKALIAGAIAVNMDTTGLEPVTPTMSTWCSNQLSYASAVNYTITLSKSGAIFDFRL